MSTNIPECPEFNKYYRKHQKHLKLKGLQPKTIEAYSKAVFLKGMKTVFCRVTEKRLKPWGIAETSVDPIC